MTRRRNVGLSDKQRDVLAAFAVMPPGTVLRATEIKRMRKIDRALESIGRSTWALANRGYVERRDGGWRLTDDGLDACVLIWGAK